MYLYLLRTENGEMFKIGKAKTPENRIYDLQKVWKFNIDFENTKLFSGNNKDISGFERTLHLLFDNYRVNDLPDFDGATEWFSVSCYEDVIEEIERAKSKFGIQIEDVDRSVIKEKFNFDNKQKESSQGKKKSSQSKQKGPKPNTKVYIKREVVDKLQESCDYFISLISKYGCIFTNEEIEAFNEDIDIHKIHSGMYDNGRLFDVPLKFENEELFESILNEIKSYSFPRYEVNYGKELKANMGGQFVTAIASKNNIAFVPIHIENISRSIDVINESLNNIDNSEFPKNSILWEEDKINEQKELLMRSKGIIINLFNFLDNRGFIPH